MFSYDLLSIFIETLTLRERNGTSSSKFETSHFRMSTFSDISFIRRVDGMASAGIIPEPILTSSGVESVINVVHVEGTPPIVGVCCEERIAGSSGISLLLPNLLNVILNAWWPIASWSINWEFHVETHVGLTASDTGMVLQSQVNWWCLKRATIILPVVEGQAALNFFGSSDSLGNTVYFGF